MLISLLTYVLLGLLLALPLWRLLRWLALRYGGYQPTWRYLRPWHPVGTAGTPGASPAPSGAHKR